MILIGLMSGTSADGIDAAVAKIDGQSRDLAVELLGFVTIPYTAETRSAIMAASECRSTVQELCLLNVWLGELFADAATKAATVAGISLNDVAAIASHGQTVWHQPNPSAIAGGNARGTLQISDPATIASRTGCTVVSDFRSADMAAGGQGAPLVPYVDWALLSSDTETRMVLNIGGIANATYLPRSCALDQVVAFDTGPGNIVIDGLVRAITDGALFLDQDGHWASQGCINQRLLGELLLHPFFELPPPKSTGREEFGGAYVNELLNRAGELGIDQADLLATATALTAEGVACAYRLWLEPRGGADTVIVGGGGCLNRTLMRMLAERLAPVRITTHAEFGIPNDAKEALAFAILGYETLHGRPSNVPSATGASKSVVLGSITPGAEGTVVVQSPSGKISLTMGKE